MDRARVVFGHLSSREEQGSPSSRSLEASPVSAPYIPDWEDDVVICSALRTPLCKARRGGFKDTLPDDLLSAVFTGVINDVGLDTTLVGDICIGNVMQPGAGAQMARIAQFFSGIPETVPLMTVNRQCSSGLQACMNVASSIKAGFCDFGIGGGVESLTINNMHKPPEGFVLNPRVMEVENARNCLVPMGITSENVAERYGISRAKQDTMAMQSHAKAAHAQKNGWFKDEIVPVNTKILDKNGDEKQVRVEQDDGIRAGTTMQILSKLKPAFQEGGSTTAGLKIYYRLQTAVWVEVGDFWEEPCKPARGPRQDAGWIKDRSLLVSTQNKGNSSQITDGAAAVLLAKRSAAKNYGFPVIGVLRGFAVVGVPPEVMGIGPAYAIPEALKKAGLTLDDIDIFEINEAFASQATYCVEKLGIPMYKVNPKGGAIALGHPLGCTGARQIATLLHEFKRRGKRAYGVVSMCIGTGMGAAAVFEYPGK